MTALLDRPRRGARPGPGDGPSLPRVLLGVALGPVLTGVAVLTAVVLVLLVAGGVDLGGAGGVVAGAWLAAHQVPLSIDGAPLGVLPLVPTAVLVWASARSTAAAGSTTPRRSVAVLVAAVLGPLLVAVAAVAVVSAASDVLPLRAPALLPSLGWVALVHLGGAALGLAGPSGAVAALRRRLPRWASAGLAQVPLVVALLVTAGCVLTSLALLRSLGTVSTLVAGGGGAAGALGLVVLSVLYLPNVVVGATSVALGPGAVLGTTTVTPFGASGGPVPPLPVLAVLPQGTGAWWWPVVLLVPAAVGALLGRRLAASGAGRGEVLRSVLTAAVGSGVVLAALGAVSGGALGAGALTPVGVPVLALGVTAAGWLALVGGATVLLLELREDAAVDADEPAEATDGSAEPVEPAAQVVVEQEEAGTEVVGDEPAVAEVEGPEPAPTPPASGDQAPPD